MEVSVILVAINSSLFSENILKYFRSYLSFVHKKLTQTLGDVLIMANNDSTALAMVHSS